MMMRKILVLIKEVQRLIKKKKRKRQQRAERNKLLIRYHINKVSIIELVQK